jgi:hypothetical protein
MPPIPSRCGDGSILLRGRSSALPGAAFFLSLDTAAAARRNERNGFHKAWILKE